MKKILLLMIACLLPIGMMAEGEYPNALIIHLNSDAIVGFPLEGTTLQLLSSTNEVKITTTDDNQSFTLSDVKSIVYEYRDLSTLDIDGITMKGTANIEVYTIDGHKKYKGNNTTLHTVLNCLSQGVYIIKVNGRTLKIAK